MQVIAAQAYIQPIKIVEELISVHEKISFDVFSLEQSLKLEKDPEIIASINEKILKKKNELLEIEN